MARKTKEPEGIHIVSVEVKDFHRLKVAAIKCVPGTGLVRITGLNASGKTTVLKSISGTLGGAGEVRADAIREGAEDGASTSVVLSNGFTVSRRITENNPKGYLTVEGPDGGKHAQKKVDGWLGDRSWDLLSFYNLKPDKMREVLLSISTDPELPTKLAQARHEQQIIKDQRTPWISQKQLCDRMKAPEGERPEPVDVSAEMGRLQELQAHEADRESKRLKLGMLAAGVTAHHNKAEQLRAEIAKLEGLIGEAEAAANEAEEVRVEVQLEYDEMTDRSEDILVVSDRISRADEVNQSLEPWKAWDKAQTDAREAATQAQALTDQINALKDKERGLLDGAGIPIKNLSFEEETGEPLLNGHPLSVASGRERIDVAVNVAMAANPDLKICLLDEANDLDLPSMEALDKRANERGFQIWLTRISDDAGCEIVVEDGVATSVTEEG